MARIDSTDYHDFIFKDGNLIGEFEQMYKKSKEVPWHQDKDATKIDYKITLAIASSQSPFDEIIDIGCGLGYFLDALKVCGTKQCKFIGYDVAPTAIKKAKHLFPKFHFNVADFTTSPRLFKTAIKIKKASRPKKSLLAIRGFFWYVFPAMDNVMTNIAYLAHQNTYLLLNQNFPPLDTPFIGKKIIPNPKKLISYFTPYFIPLINNWLEDRKSKGNDNWFTALMVKR